MSVTPVLPRLDVPGARALPAPTGKGPSASPDWDWMGVQNEPPASIVTTNDSSVMDILNVQQFRTIQNDATRSILATLVPSSDSGVIGDAWDFALLQMSKERFLRLSEYRDRYNSSGSETGSATSASTSTLPLARHSSQSPSTDGVAVPRPGNLRPSMSMSALAPVHTRGKLHAPIAIAGPRKSVSRLSPAPAPVRASNMFLARMEAECDATEEEMQLFEQDPLYHVEPSAINDVDRRLDDWMTVDVDAAPRPSTGSPAPLQPMPFPAATATRTNASRLGSTQQRMTPTRERLKSTIHSNSRRHGPARADTINNAGRRDSGTGASVDTAVSAEGVTLIVGSRAVSTVALWRTWFQDQLQQLRSAMQRDAPYRMAMHLRMPALKDSQEIFGASEALARRTQHVLHRHARSGGGRGGRGSKSDAAARAAMKKLKYGDAIISTFDFAFLELSRGLTNECAEHGMLLESLWLHARMCLIARAQHSLQFTEVAQSALEESCEAVVTAEMTHRDRLQQVDVMTTLLASARQTLNKNKWDTETFIKNHFTRQFRQGRRLPRTPEILAQVAAAALRLMQQLQQADHYIALQQQRLKKLVEGRRAERRKDDPSELFLPLFSLESVTAEIDALEAEAKGVDPTASSPPASHTSPHATVAGEGGESRQAASQWIEEMGSSSDESDASGSSSTNASRVSEDDMSGDFLAPLPVSFRRRRKTKSPAPSPPPPDATTSEEVKPAPAPVDIYESDTDRAIATFRARSARSSLQLLPNRDTNLLHSPLKSIGSTTDMYQNIVKDMAQQRKPSSARLSSSRTESVDTSGGGSGSGRKSALKQVAVPLDDFQAGAEAAFASYRDTKEPASVRFSAEIGIIPALEEEADMSAAEQAPPPEASNEHIGLEEDDDDDGESVDVTAVSEASLVAEAPEPVVVLSREERRRLTRKRRARNDDKIPLDEESVMAVLNRAIETVPRYQLQLDIMALRAKVGVVQRAVERVQEEHGIFSKSVQVGESVTAPLRRALLDRLHAEHIAYTKAQIASARRSRTSSVPDIGVDGTVAGKTSKRKHHRTRKSSIPDGKKGAGSRRSSAPQVIGVGSSADKPRRKKSARRKASAHESAEDGGTGSGGEDEDEEDEEEEDEEESDEGSGGEESESSSYAGSTTSSSLLSSSSGSVTDEVSASDSEAVSSPDAPPKKLRSRKDLGLPSSAASKATTATGKGAAGSSASRSGSATSMVDGEGFKSLAAGHLFQEVAVESVSKPPRQRRGSVQMSVRSKSTDPSPRRASADHVDVAQLGIAGILPFTRPVSLPRPFEPRDGYVQVGDDAARDRMGSVSAFYDGTRPSTPVTEYVTPSGFHVDPHDDLAPLGNPLRPLPLPIPMPAPAPSITLAKATPGETKRMSVRLSGKAKDAGVLEIEATTVQISPRMAVHDTADSEAVRVVKQQRRVERGRKSSITLEDRLPLLTSQLQQHIDGDAPAQDERMAVARSRIKRVLKSDVKLNKCRGRVAAFILKPMAPEQTKSSFPLRWLLAQINTIYAAREDVMRSLLTSLLGPEFVDPLVASRLALLGSRASNFAVPSKAAGAAAMTARGSGGTTSRNPTAVPSSTTTGGAFGVKRQSSYRSLIQPQAPDTAYKCRSVARVLLEEATDPVSVSLSDGRLDYFVADVYQRRFGIDALARKHTITLLKCVNFFKEDARVNLFLRFVSNKMLASDMLFFLCVRSLGRAGVPRDAWAITDVPVGGKSHVKTMQAYSLLWASIVLRRAVQRMLQRVRGGGPGAVVDMVRTRRAVRLAMQTGVLRVNDAYDPMPQRRLPSSLQLTPGVDVVAMSSCTFTPRTAYSLMSAELAARTPVLLSAFPFLRAALVMADAHKRAPANTLLPLITGSTPVAMTTSRGPRPTSPRRSLHQSHSQPSDLRAVSAAATHRSQTDSVPVPSSRRQLVPQLNLGASQSTTVVSLGLPPIGTTQRTAGRYPSATVLQPLPSRRLSSPLLAASPIPTRRDSTTDMTPHQSGAPTGRTEAEEGEATPMTASSVSLGSTTTRRLSASRMPRLSFKSPEPTTGRARSTSRPRVLSESPPPRDTSGFPPPLSSADLSSRRPAEGVCAYTLWSPSRLVRLLLMTPSEELAKGSFLCSTSHNVSFPDGLDGIPSSSQGQPQWMSMKRAHEIVRLMMMAHEQQDAILGLTRLKEVGLPPQYAIQADKWPKPIRRLYETTARIDRDAFASLLLTIRERSRLEFLEQLSRDFKTFTKTKNGTMNQQEFTTAIATMFPYTFPEPLIHAMYERGRVLEGRTVSATASGAVPIASAWALHMWVEHIADLSENALR